MGTRFEGNDIDAARLRSLTSQEAFDERDDVPWRDDYAALLGDEWPWYDGPEWNRWRLAAYVAWESYRGAEERWPATLEALAQLLGWQNGQALRRYRRRYRELERLVREAIMRPLLARRAQVLDTLGVMAEMPDYKAFKDRELFLKMTRLYEPKQTIDMHTSVNADQMAAAQDQAQNELGDFDASFFDGDDGEEDEDVAD